MVIVITVKTNQGTQLLERTSKAHAPGDPPQYIAWLRSTPEKGKANIELIRLVARYFKTHPSAVRILRGKTSRRKFVLINKTAST